MSLPCGNGVFMHRNYRRRWSRQYIGRLNRWRTMPAHQSQEDQRISWKQRRAEIRRLFHEEDYELMPSWYPKCIRWIYW